MHRLAVVIIGALALVSLAASQTLDLQVPAAAQSTTLSPAQLDQLTAPIALYPDPLLGAVLTGSTYPLEVVEAARWLDDPAIASLRGDALAAALQQQSWDTSVKSLVSFPDVLAMMNHNLQWTERLGDAFLAQQSDVMDSIQRLRQRATAAGTLRSTPQQTVTTEDQTVAIEPSNPQVVYVPYYEPSVVYGPWPWPDYPPFYFGIAPGVVVGDFMIGFGIGVGIFGPFWGGWGWDWPHHGFYVRPHRPGEPSPPWRHDPDHRRGVPYRDAATGARFGAGAAGARREFRGFPGTAGSVPSPHAPTAESRVQPAAPRTQPAMPRVAPAMPRPAPPAFQSFGRGSQVRGDAARGSFSRSSPGPAPAPHGGGPHHR